MKEKQEVAFIGFDVSKNAHAVVIAEDGRRGEVRVLGAISATPAAVQKLLKKLTRGSTVCTFAMRLDQPGMSFTGR